MTRNQALISALAMAIPTLAARPANAKCGDLLIVLDRSGSMANCNIDGVTKESIARKALMDLTKEFPTMPMGLAVFPNTLAGSCSGGSACAAGKMVLDVTADGASKVASWLPKMPTSCGGTPTGSTMEVIRDYTKWEPGRDHFVLLLTDGQPTCDDGDDGSTYDTMSMSCTGGGAGTPCNGAGLCECRNPTRAYDAIKALADKSIHTFVVGFAGMATGCATMAKLPFNAATLDQMADLGGEPQSPPADSKYYLATDAASLKDALTKIAGKVLGGTVGGCAPEGGGSGGSGAGGSGSGGSGGSGGAGGDSGGGTGGQGGAGEDDPGGGRKSSPPGPFGCACTTGAAPAAPTSFLCLGVMVALAWGRRRR